MRSTIGRMLEHSLIHGSMTCINLALLKWHILMTLSHGLLAIHISNPAA